MQQFNMADRRCTINIDLPNYRVINTLYGIEVFVGIIMSIKYAICGMEKSQKLCNHILVHNMAHIGNLFIENYF